MQLDKFIGLYLMLAQCLHDFTISYGLPLSLFLGGLVGGFTHCTAMCSPFILAQTDGHGMQFLKALLLPYHFGRMTTYVVLALLVNGVINMAFLFSDMKVLIAAPMLMLAAILFFVTAFPALAKVFPWVHKMKPYVPYVFFEGVMNKLSVGQSAFKRYVLGVFLGFMPCGLVMAALMAAASAENMWMAGLAMASFAAGTVPALVIVALGGQTLRQKFPQWAARFKAGALTISGIWLFIIAGAMILV